MQNGITEKYKNHSVFLDFCTLDFNMKDVYAEHMQKKY